MGDTHEAGTELRDMKAQLRAADPDLAKDLELIESEMKPQYIGRPHEACAMCALNRIARRLLSAEEGSKT